MRARCSLLTDPWWARASAGSAPWPVALPPISWAGVRAGSDAAAVSCRSAQASLSRAVSRSASPRELQKTMVERTFSRRSRRSCSTCGQMDPSSPRLVMSSTGTVTSRTRSDSLSGATMRTGARPPRKRATSSCGRTVALRPDPAGRLLEQPVEALEREGEVGAALGAGDRVDLVDDDGVDVAQRLARRRREHQEQRLRRGDEDVGRMGDQPAALLLGGVARADPDRDLVERLAAAGPGLGDADERGAEVALDVDRERLERRHVQHPGAQLASVRDRRLRVQQPVDARQERGQRLARAGGCHHEHVVALVESLPGADLRRRGRGEGLREPLARRGCEAIQRVGHALIVAGAF